MNGKETYIDHNVVVDLVNGRKVYSLASVAAKKEFGCIFPYSPFHLEEVAAILGTDLDKEKQRQHIKRHLDTIRTVSDLWEYVPGGHQPIQIIQEDPLDSFRTRVLKEYWITDECSGLEEFIDSQRSQKHCEDYLNRIKIEPKGQIRSRETIRKEVGIDINGLSHLDPTQVLSDVRVQEILSQKVGNYGIAMEDFPCGGALRVNHDLTTKTIDCLMRVLNEAGFYPDRPGKHRSYMFDVGHTIYATRAATFVVGDFRLSKRAKAILSFLKAETKIVAPDDFFDNRAVHTDN